MDHRFLILLFLLLLALPAFAQNTLHYQAPGDGVTEPISFRTTDTSAFSLHIRKDPSENDVMYWGWNPPYVGNDGMFPSATFSLERNYHNNIEWNFDIRGAIDPLDERYHTRPIHSMIDRRTGYPKSLEFVFAGIRMFSVRPGQSQSKTEYAAFTKDSSVFYSNLQAKRGLQVDGSTELTAAPQLSTSVQSLGYKENELIIDWSRAGIHSCDISGAETCTVQFRNVQKGASVTLILTSSDETPITWEGESGAIPMLWKNGEAITTAGPTGKALVLTLRAIPMPRRTEAILVQDAGVYE